MSLHYHLAVELELAGDLDPADLDTVRWLFGLTDTRPPVAPVTDPLVQPEHTDTDGWWRAPGGAWARLVHGRRPAPAGSTQVGWSVAARDVLLDDHFYADAPAVLGRLATRSSTQGLIATAREEMDLLPSWLFYAFAGQAYLLHEGELVPYEGELLPSEDARPAPRHVRSELDRLSGRNNAT
ncbi:hypothetical protein ACNTMW_33115 [Planosporangium sp. 12N6]|uniref:hypothetical protein n=1 Tax=Planosporangium spinosum TaxID=3402278 RepID=UPI003CF0F999